MNPALKYPTPEAVEAASRTELREWLNNLPGSSDKAHHAIISRIVARLAEFRQNPYGPPPVMRPRVEPSAKALHDAGLITPPVPSKPVKTAPLKPEQATDAPAGASYFKSLFS